MWAEDPYLQYVDDKKWDDFVKKSKYNIETHGAGVGTVKQHVTQGTKRKVGVAFPIAVAPADMRTLFTDVGTFNDIHISTTLRPHRQLTM